MREIVLDTETTGLDPADGHRVLEIGAVEIVHQSLTGNVFHVLINPERDVPEDAARVHGHTAEVLKDKPVFAKIIDDVRSSLALEYLKTTKMSADDIATLLGFSDSAAFRKALKRWTGKGLAELRGRHG